MLVNGQITNIFPIASGVSQAGKQWARQDYIVTYDATKPDYPKTILFSVMNDNIEKLGIKVGSFYDLEVDFTTREYNGRTYMQASCWKATEKMGTTTAQAPTYQQPQPASYPSSPVQQYQSIIQANTQGVPTPPPAEPSNNDPLPF